MDIYVVVTENNEEHATPSGRKYCDDRGPLVFEQYTRDADLKSIKERANVVEKNFGGHQRPNGKDGCVIKKIYCTGCSEEVDARLTNGSEIYPHRKDLEGLPFWKCDKCNNYVGCHHKTKERTRPLGNIPTKELRGARKHIHKILDPLWKMGGMKRRELYAMISDYIGREYHTADIRDIEEARKIYIFIKRINKEALC